MTNMMDKEHGQKYFQALKPVADDLRKIGIEIKKGDFTHLQAKNGVIISLSSIGMEQNGDDLQYLYNKYKTLPRGAIDILLKWIPVTDYPPAQEVLIAGLRGTKFKYDGNILLNVFKNTNSSLVRDRIGFVLKSTNPHIDSRQLKEILQNSVYGQEKSTLIYAAIKYLSKEELNPILMAEFENHFLRCLSHIKKTAGLQELHFLKSEFTKNIWNKKQKTQIEQSIKIIENRLKF